MQSKFYQPDEQRAERVHELFATIAKRYDLLNDIMSAGLHRRWKRRLVAMAEVVAASIPDASTASRRDGGHYNQRVLDLCCGTGDIALCFRRAYPTAEIIGADFTMEMLRVAEARCSRETFSRRIGETGSPGGREKVSRPQDLRWIRADALRLPFADDSFDVVSIGYGLRNLADLERGLREVQRVLRPGGKLLSLDFGKPESPALRRAYFAYLRTVLPILGRLYCGDPDTHGYILVSLQEYPAQRGIKLLMESCGYCDCGFEEFIGGTMAINFGSKPR